MFPYPFNIFDIIFNDRVILRNAFILLAISACESPRKNNKSTELIVLLTNAHVKPLTKHITLTQSFHFQTVQNI